MAERRELLDFELMYRIGHRRSCPVSPVANLLCYRDFFSRSFTRSAGNAGGPHHVDHACGEAEQQKHDHPPRRDVEPAIERPTNEGTDRDAADQFGGKPEAAGECRRIAFRTGPGFDLPARPFLVGEPFAETPEPRGGISLL